MSDDVDDTDDSAGNCPNRLTVTVCDEVTHTSAAAAAAAASASSCCRGHSASTYSRGGSWCSRQSQRVIRSHIQQQQQQQEQQQLLLASCCRGHSASGQHKPVVAADAAVAAPSAHIRKGCCAAHVPDCLLWQRLAHILGCCRTIMRTRLCIHPPNHPPTHPPTHPLKLRHSIIAS